MFVLPEEVNIGPVPFKIVIEPRLAADGAYGSLVRALSIIEIHPNMTPAMQELTLWHEVIHEWIRQLGIRDISETTVEGLASCVMLFMKSNPAMVAVRE